MSKKKEDREPELFEQSPSSIPKDRSDAIARVARVLSKFIPQFSRETLEDSIEHLPRGTIDQLYVMLYHNASKDISERKDFRELRNRIVHHQPRALDHAYENIATFDAIKAIAEFFQKLQPSLKNNRVGARPSTAFLKVRHEVPMLSLENAFSENDVRAFAERIRRFLRISPSEPLIFTA
jgi:hypothetical protein